MKRKERHCFAQTANPPSYPHCSGGGTEVKLSLRKGCEEGVALIVVFFLFVFCFILWFFSPPKSILNSKQINFPQVDCFAHDSNW